MKIAESEYKEHIREKWIDACIYYEAMKAEAQKYGIEDIPTPTPTPTPTPDPQPEPTPTPTPEPSGEPAFVYDGPASYTINRGEHAKFTIYVKNATSKDFECTVPGEPAYIKADDKWVPIDSGYRIEVDVRGINVGGGEYCLYWKADAKNKDNWLRIKIIVNG